VGNLRRMAAARKTYGRYGRWFSVSNHDRGTTDREI
jgi:hypothetical protein